MENKDKNNRRKFLKNSLAMGIGTATGLSFLAACGSDHNPKGKKVKMLTTEGQLVEVDESAINYQEMAPAYGKEARKGIPGRKFVMVIDLAKCKNAGKCRENCQEGHDLSPDQEWLKVLLMKDHDQGEPYWFPKPCYHCDNPPCVKVCPCDATFKRQDGIVLVDNERCIGCKFCISACPYSARIFNWEHKKEPGKHDNDKYSPETSVPAQVGTIGKCDFCPDMSRNGKLPYCVSGCPMGAIYFGDENEDTVTNDTETLRFKQLLADRAGYRHMEELGTKPRVYYLPPVNRMFPYERGLENMTDEEKSKYDDII